MKKADERAGEARFAEIVDTLAEALGSSREEALERIAHLCARLPLSGDAFTAVIRTAQRQRMRRNAVMGVELFRDPAWDMLLELLLIEREGLTVSVSALCFASGVPATTALRHIDWMEEGGLITRRGDFADHRRVLVALAPGVADRLEPFLRELYVDAAVAAAQLA